MAVSILTPTAKQGGTYTVQVDFKDQDDVAVTPKSATWTLKDSGGTVVNSRLDVNISSLDTTVYITLTGSDLPVNTHPLEELTITVTAIYDSATYGNDLTLIGQAKISVESV